MLQYLWGVLMKSILIIFTGGTISMHYDQVFSKSVIEDNHQLLIEKIESKVSNIKIDSLVYSMIPSPAITPFDMFRIGLLVEEKISSAKYDGIVITHGTDTLSETAYFLDLFLNIENPVVLTGSMRNYDEVGYDGFSNLVSAILVAACNKSSNRGVLVCLNDEINSATEVLKTHTIALGTFKSLEFGPLGLVDEKTVSYYRDITYKRMHIPIKSLTKKVEIVKVVSGFDPDLIDYYIKKKTDGLILEAMGRGNVPPTMIESLKKAIAANISVVITSKCPMGRVRDTYAYEGGGFHLKSLGVLSGGSLSSEKARLKLMMVLSAGLDPKKYFIDD